MNIMAVDMTHSDIQSVNEYQTLVANEERVKQIKAIEGLQSSQARMMVITQYYKPYGASLALFQAVGARCVLSGVSPQIIDITSSTSKDYTADSLREDVLSEYISQHSLINIIDPDAFNLDDLLKSILGRKKNPPGSLKRQVGLERLMNTCQPWYEIGREGRGQATRLVFILIR